MERLIVGIGEALWDMLPTGKQLGGAPANFAYHVKQLGLPAQVVSAVGNDEPGAEILHVFEEKNISSYVQKVDYPTGTVQVSLDEAGVPSYEIKTDVAWDNIPFTAEMGELAAHTQAVCFGSLAQRNEVSRATINRFLDTMPKGEEVLKIFDINLRQQFYTKEIIHESLCKCNVLKINDEELDKVKVLFDIPVSRMVELPIALEEKSVSQGIVPDLLTDSNSTTKGFVPSDNVPFFQSDVSMYEENLSDCQESVEASQSGIIHSQIEICRKLLVEYQLRYVILTCGEKGSFVFTPDGMSHFETPEVSVADTVGAGDAFTAAFVAGLLQGKSVREAHRLAVELSAYVCTQHGAMPDYQRIF